MKRFFTTITSTIIVSACAVLLAHLPEIVEVYVLLHGVMVETILMLVLPILPFVAFGLFASRMYQAPVLGSVLLVCLASNGLLHYFGCGPLWQRHTTPGVVFDSLLLDILYHVVIIVSTAGIVALKNQKRE